MQMKVMVLVLATLSAAFRLLTNLLSARSAKNPIPQNVADVYDEAEYKRWRAYQAENSRLGIYSTLASWLVTVVLLAVNAYAWAGSIAEPGSFGANAAVLMFYIIVNELVSLPFSLYDTFMIEAKYGFNKATKKTFVLDLLRGLLVNVLMTGIITGVMALTYAWLGDWMIIAFVGLMMLVMLAILFLFPIFSRLGNKFTSLEEGELRTRLMELLTSHSYKVKDIKVMDASRRTTKSNAYFAGLGKTKTIVLYDNLLTLMTPDEIVAVFAHEMGHGLHHDMIKNQAMNALNFTVIGVVAWLTMRTAALYPPFGFEGLNYAFAYVLLGDAFLGVVSPLVSMMANWHSRRAEYRADAQAVAEDCGAGLITGLKKLSKDSLADLSPSKWLVRLEYNHPPMSERISAIENAMKRQ